MKRVLFVCVENSTRSQMAEAFARIHGAGRVEAASDGSRPSGRVNPKAITAMQELGYDLAAHASKGVDDHRIPARAGVSLLAEFTIARRSEFRNRLSGPAAGRSPRSDPARRNGCGWPDCPRHRAGR